MLRSIRLKYQEDLKKIFKGNVDYDLCDIFTYLFYCIKKNDEGEEFKQCKEVSNFSRFFHDTNIANYFRSETEELSVESIYYLFGLYDTTDIDLLREILQDSVRYYFIDSLRTASNEEGKYGVDDLILRMLRLKRDQEFLLVYNQSSSIVQKLIDKKIKLSIYFDSVNTERRARGNNCYDYFLLKVFVDVNDYDVDIIVGDRFLEEKKFDRIYCEYYDAIKTDNALLQNDVICKYLKKDGIAIKTVSDVVLDASGDDMVLARAKDLDSKKLKAIITFPSTIGARYFRRGTNKAIMLYDNIEEHEAVYMVDAQTVCVSDKNSSWFTVNNIEDIINYTGNEKKGISKKVDYKKIKESKDASFSPYDYVDRGISLNNAVELGTIADIRRGNVEYIKSRIKTNDQEDDSEEEYKYKRISPSFLDDENYEGLEEIKTDKNLSDSVLENGDILLNKNGNPIRIVLFEGDKELGVIADGNIIIIHPNKEKVVPEYLKIYLDSEEGRKSLENIAHSGIALRSINISRLIKVMIPLVDIDKQLKFVEDYNEILKNIEREKNKLQEQCIKYFYK